MSLLLETIQCKNGVLKNLDYHQSRFNYARRKYFGCKDELILRDVLHIPLQYRRGLFRCRVVYSATIEMIEFIPHQYRPIRKVKLIENNSIDYQFKYANRSELNALFYQRGPCDDILIVKNGMITDSLTANVILFDGKKWWTPDAPLLNGTQRARLLEERKIEQCRITLKSLSRYEKAGFINAMQDMEQMPVVPVENIVP